MSPEDHGMVGRTIGDDYEVLEEIGHGSFGIVYRCRELSLGKVVALKLLSREVHSARVLESFLEEGRKLASLNHPNVIQVHRAGRHGDRPYIVMEYVEGSTLRHLLRKPRIPLTKALDLMSQVARGLHAIHAQGIIHRDLSANNIMITSEGTAKILDLGLARFADSSYTLSSSGSVAGTLLYIAPEIIAGRPATFASDIFAFGVLMYESIAGRNPFEGENLQSTLYNISHRDPDPLDKLFSQVSPRLVRLVQHCLEKDPGDRINSLSGIADQILRCIHESPSELILDAGVVPPVREASHANPYLNRGMIRRAGDFVGRAQEVKRIYSRLNATPPGSISIIGDRRIGKSSLLNFVYMKLNRDVHLEKPDAIAMIFMDLQQYRDVTLGTFLSELMRLVRVEVAGRLSRTDWAPTLDGMKSMVETLNRNGLRFAMLFDEFEIVTSNPNFSLEFFSFLRFLANHYDVVYLTSSVHDLQVLCHTKEISDSPFFNIFTTVRLSAFSEGEARDLAVKPSLRTGFPLESHCDFIFRELSGHFPMFIQIACSHFIECAKERTDPTQVDPEEVRAQYCEEARPHYKFLWDSFDVHERAVVSRIANRKGVPESLRDVALELERKGYATSAGGAPRLFSGTFERFVQSETARERPTSLWERMRKRILR